MRLQFPAEDIMINPIRIFEGLGCPSMRLFMKKTQKCQGNVSKKTLHFNEIMVK